MRRIYYAVVLLVFSNVCDSQWRYDYYTGPFIDMDLDLIPPRVHDAVRNVRLVNHADYLVSVVQATVSELEERGWWNLKLPETVQNINETIFDWEVLGTVTYKNGFLVSIQHMDIQQSSVQQAWSRTKLGQVEVRGRLRMHNVVVGFDVLANLNDKDYRYTGTFMHPIVNFDFSIIRDLNKYTTTGNVVAVIPNPPSASLPRITPNDNISDVLNQLYLKSSAIPGMTAWGPDVITPILGDIISKKIEFATVCYNCPA